MIVLTFIDIDKKEVPDGITVFLFFTGFVLNALELNGNMNIFSGIAGALFAGFLLLMMNYFTGGKIGEGDVKVFAAIGLCLGLYETGWVIFWSFVAGCVISLALLIAGRIKRRDEIAFVPYIAMGFLIQCLIL